MNLTSHRWRTVLRSTAIVLMVSSRVLGSNAMTAPVMARAPVYASHGVVSSDNPLASQAGLKVLEAGGNAFDAAVVAAAVLNVTEPMMTGIGGDMFALAWVEREQRLVGLNGSGRSGSRFTREAFLADGLTELPLYDARVITVPGALAGWASLLERYGTLTLAQALEPAARIAEDGFLVSANTAYFWALMHKDLQNDAARKTFLLEGGRPPRPGEWYANPDLAKTFRAIGKHGASWLYGGELGQAIAGFIEREGGCVTLQDLAAHESLWVEPMSASFGEFKLWELPPNGQGVAALEMIRILDTPEFRSYPHNSADYLHHLLEAKKLAFADLEETIADPASMRIPPTQLLDESFVAPRRALIDPDRAQSTVEPDERLLKSDTTFFTAADRHGNMVGIINSLCSGFGSGMVVPGTGFILQNRGVAFTLEPGRVNTVAPGRRPFHTIIPGFITRHDKGGEDRPWATMGIIGGDNQPQAHVQAFLNLTQFEMNAQQALDAPRFRHVRERLVLFENRIAPEVVAELEARGHVKRDTPYPPGDLFGTGNIIRRLERGYEAASDTRSDGLPAGY